MPSNDKARTDIKNTLCRNTKEITQWLALEGERRSGRGVGFFVKSHIIPFAFLRIPSVNKKLKWKEGCLVHCKLDLCDQGSVLTCALLPPT